MDRILVSPKALAVAAALLPHVPDGTVMTTDQALIAAVGLAPNTVSVALLELSSHGTPTITRAGVRTGLRTITLQQSSWIWAAVAQVTDEPRTEKS